MNAFSIPSWVCMWAMAVGVFASLKALTWRKVVREGAAQGVGNTAGYFLGWVGLDPRQFLMRSAVRPALGCWVMSILKMGLGSVLLWGVAPRFMEETPLLAGWIGMVGMIFILHFGLFALLALAWQASGRGVEMIMCNPIASRSVREFWGRRWNRAFHAAVESLVFRPCARRLGATGALLVTFTVSGLIHDLMISVPACGGYGLPTLYFLLQGSAIVLERTIGLNSGLRGWLFTMLVVGPPAFILFHPPFVLRVVVPFMHALGAG